MIWTPYWGGVPVTGKIKKKDWAKVQNNREFMNTFMIFYTLALELYQWNGLPETCDSRMIEQFLLLNGQIMICKAEGRKLENLMHRPGASSGGTFAYLSLASAGGYDINLYGYPTRAYGYGLNGTNEQFSTFVAGADKSPLLLQSPAGSLPPEYMPESVICYDNAMAYPYIAYIMADASRLADLVRSTDVAVKTLKSPILIGVNESERTSLRQLLEDYEDNVFTILTAKGFSLDSIKVWPTQGNPETLRAIWDQYLNIWGRLLSIFGLRSNTQPDKAERLVVAEATANDQFTASSLNKRLAWRQKFCDEINALWGLNVSVEINPEVMAYARVDDSYGLYEDGSDDGAGGGDADTGGDA